MSKKPNKKQELIIGIFFIAIIIIAVKLATGGEDSKETATITETVEEAPTPTVEGFPEPSRFQEGTSEAALYGFLSNLAEENFQGMLPYCQKTWLANHEETAIANLQGQFLVRTDMVGFDIVSVNEVSEVIHDVTYRLSYRFADKVITIERSARAIRETAKYTPRKNGDWGINPISAI